MKTKNDIVLLDLVISSIKWNILGHNMSMSEAIKNNTDLIKELDLELNKRGHKR